MSLAIVHYNSPILRKKGEKITTFDAALESLAAEMIETMHQASGIGLAAQQVGRALQLFVMDLRETEAEFKWELDGGNPPIDLFMPMVVVNPRISVEKGTEEKPYEEGCLSFPEIRGDVVRPDRITLKFQDEKGGAHTLVCTGLLSRCIQHETDHVQGILFTDRMDKKVRAPLENAIKALAKKTRDELA